MPSKPSSRSEIPERRKPVATRTEDPGIDSAHCQQDQPKANGVQSKDVQGLKYLEMLIPLFEWLHDEQTARDKANNRELHFDEYCMLVLLYMFNPTVTSLRAIAQASELAKVHKKLGSTAPESDGILRIATNLLDVPAEIISLILKS